LAKPDTQWPSPKETFKNQVERNLGGKFKGYVLDKEDRPIFHYILNDIDIQEQPMPLLKSGGADLLRKFQLSSKQPVAGLYFLAAEGKQIQPKSPDEWIVSTTKLVGAKHVETNLSIRIADKPAGMGHPIIRDFNGVQQLLIPITFDNGSATFNVEMSW
jgi:hypothetical protein